MLYLACKYRFSLGDWEGHWYSLVTVDPVTFAITVEDEVSKNQAIDFIKEHNLTKVLKNESGVVWDTEENHFKKFIEEMRTFKKGTPQFDFMKKVKQFLDNE